MSARTGRDTGLLYFSSTRMRSERSARACRIYLDHSSIGHGQSDIAPCDVVYAMSLTFRQSCIVLLERACRTVLA
jgi:hypothetical protein